MDDLDEMLYNMQGERSLSQRLLNALGVGNTAPPPVSGEVSPKRPAAQAAAQPTRYPTSEDVAFARQHDYSYGQPWAPEFQGNAYRLLAGDPNESPLQTMGISADRLRSKAATKEIPSEFNDYYAKAALAVQNSGLALLGFDPSRVAADVTRDPKRVNILGTYNRKTDEIYANARDPSTIVHESIHRGIQKLKESPFWKPEFEEVGRSNNESAVRWLMQLRMGDPESENEGSVNQKQVKTAKWVFKDSRDAVRLSRLLDEMDYAASQYMAAKRPGGPR